MQNNDKHNSVTLIGMPGVGKSTVGAILAARLNREYIDTDSVIEAQNGGRLQQVLDSGDREAFCIAEEKAVLSLQLHDNVVATGGSVVYSDLTMQHLSNQSVIVYLTLDLVTLTERLGDVSERGLLRLPGQSIEDLYNERGLLYKRWATYELDCCGYCAEQIADQVIGLLS